MRSDGAALPYLIERGAIGRRSIVSEIGDGESRREVDACVVRRHEVTGEGAGLSQGRVLEDAAPAQGFCEQIPDDALHVEPPRAAEEVVIGEAALELSEVDGVESGADARLARRRFLDGNDDDLR